MSKFVKTLIAMSICCCFLLCGACKTADLGKDSENDKDSVDHGEYSRYTQLVIDGGGQNISYNTTQSLKYDKYTNPYPYNTLERLAEEWNKANASVYGYYFTVAKTSINMDRETMVPMLQNGNAPEIIYYLGTTAAEDQNKGWFYDLKGEMEKPNKYSKQGESGSVKWKDIYTSEEYGSFFTPNGQLFTVLLEKNPIGILYNKTILDAAGVTKTPETFKEFMEAQDKISAYSQTVGRGDKNDDSKYICPFFSYYPWYNSYLESSLFAEDLEYFDVINVNGRIDSEEYVRAFMTKDPDGNRTYSLDNEKYEELYRLIKLECKYYPERYQSYYAEQQFVSGNLAMIEVTGGSIRSFIDQVDGDFEIGVFPYPMLATQPDGEDQNEYYTKYNKSDYIVRRGLSGYSTGWAITNSAMKKDAAKSDDKCVAACVDMLMYLSCFENNDKLVNDRGFAIPLSGNTTYEHFVALAKQYETDCKNEKAVAWACATAGDNMNKDFYDAVYLFRNTALDKNGNITKADLKTLLNSFTAAANTLYTQNKWDRTKWPAYGYSNKTGK